MYKKRNANKLKNYNHLYQIIIKPVIHSLYRVSLISYNNAKEIKMDNLEVAPLRNLDDFLLASSRFQVNKVIIAGPILLHSFFDGFTQPYKFAIIVVLFLRFQTHPIQKDGQTGLFQTYYIISQTIFLVQQLFSPW